ncbi:hypothetical protein [Streptomyces spectabilis]|uniref:Small-conductance mechanosensitive channel n=1 Tax=Streptomyces spectabilis TaxID=68270 RepID=A0A5P2X0K6_STRST|nr:hypothetical protein [Streptomyces spectabilis]MBB5108289.1 small-conductance mechanosensitive channel [Streptomyces spectabilis]MCI3901049.1 hypothetical protein [Streptomyces spectabilis]QEV58547.1 hypothetical protein CP982_07340 [Streptomyces spectabilis]GGV45651.1 hypothetical protein GCM10010245_71500 [Streptomyces spectabilis]
MPEETEQAAEQQESPQPTEQVVAKGDAEEVEEPSAGDAPEAEPDKKDEPFDEARAKAALRKKNSENENLRKRLKEAEPLLAELKRRQQAELSESERLTEQLGVAQEQIAKTRQRLVRSQVQALAGAATDARPAFADPADAFGELDLDSYIDDSGDIDEAAIEADLQALLERKPHWAKSQPQEGPRRPAPDRTQASGANKKQAPSPRDEFAGWLSTQLK